MYTPDEKIVPYGSVFSRPEYNDLIQWKKNIKVDTKAYKEFKDETRWNLYKKHFKKRP
jgi:hypothetical protein